MIIPKIILCLRDGCTTETVYTLRASSGLDCRQVLRPDAQSELRDSLIKDDLKTIVQYVIEQPATLERPFVVTDKGTRLCRLIKTSLDIINLRPNAPWLTKRGLWVI